MDVESDMMEGDSEEEDSKEEDNSDVFVYRRTLNVNNTYGQGNFTRILTSQPVKVVFIHRKGFKAKSSLVKLELDDEVKTVRTYAYFELAKYKFFTQADYFATDLANIVKLGSQEFYHMHAMKASAPLQGPLHGPHHLWSSGEVHQLWSLSPPVAWAGT